MHLIPDHTRHILGWLETATQLTSLSLPEVESCDTLDQLIPFLDTHTSLTRVEIRSFRQPDPVRIRQFIEATKWSSLRKFAPGWLFELAPSKEVGGYLEMVCGEEDGVQKRRNRTLLQYATWDPHAHFRALPGLPAPEFEWP